MKAHLIHFYRFLITGLILILFQGKPALLAGEDLKTENINAKTNWTVLPFFFYSPETSLALGGGGGVFFRPSIAEKSDRPSSFRFFAYYTLKKQWQFEFTPEIYFKGGIYRIEGNLFLNRFVDKFYGIGNSTLLSDEEDYISKSFRYFIRFYRRMIGHFYLAIQHEYHHYRLTNTELGSLLGSGQIPGSLPADFSGISLFSFWDSRDNIMFPGKGSFHEASMGLFRKGLGSDFDCTIYNLNLRKYFPVFSSRVLALHVYLRFIDGNSPFQWYSYFGGESYLRGYYKGRYRDKQTVFIQMEYRTPLWKRLGAAVFGGVGEVMEKINHFSFDRLRASWGFGLRFNLIPEEHLNIRLDFGFGHDMSGFYVTVTEAF
ncbi:MAG: BamA/TamA family outer membrane protein [Candidatus Aminicenantes bacterium]|nr:BamA/TamA family outer membrane protein [Candidatus Aminicenantes bacterium]